jgi:hypothetical protein
LWVAAERFLVVRYAGGAPGQREACYKYWDYAFHLYSPILAESLRLKNNQLCANKLEFQDLFSAD